MKKCLKCNNENLQLYYEKQDGETFVRYYRCPECTEVYEIKIYLDSEKYFRNIRCQFFPCHGREDQNCLFCFCALYNTKQCEKNINCENCYYPHEYKNYEKIIEKLKNEYKKES